MDTIHQTQEAITKKYDLLADKFQVEYVKGKDRGHKAMAAALEKAHQQLVEAEEFSEDIGQDLKRFMSRDLEQISADMEDIRDSVKEKINPSRLASGALSSLVSVLEMADSSLHSLSQKTKEKITYKTGELTSAGTLTCNSCGQTAQLKATGHVPPCPKCKATKFSKGY